MSTSLLDRAETRTDTATTTTAAQRLSRPWPPCGSRHRVRSQQELDPRTGATAAEAFDAEAKSLNAAKKLLDTKHSAYPLSLPCGARSLRTGSRSPCRFPSLASGSSSRATSRRLHATGRLQSRAGRRRRRAGRAFRGTEAGTRQRLASLYNEQDYPESLSGLFAVAYDFPSVEPPGYLVALSPLLYEQEQARVSARFEEAVRLAEEAFLAEFGRLVVHLTERINGTNEDGTPKVFRDSAIGNLIEFFDRFRQLNVRSSEQLDALVAEAQRIVRHVEPQELRDSNALRERVVSQLSRVQSSLDEMLVDRPRRRILRNPSPPGEA